MKPEFPVCAIKRIWIFMAIFAVAALAGCSTADISSLNNPASAGDAVDDESLSGFTVSFYSNGQLISRENIAQWSTPDCPEAKAEEGQSFLYWADESGQRVEPEHTPVRCDTDYTAVFAPVLDRHVPYLFTDEYGLLRPDEGLDNSELEKALYALAGEEAMAYFPEFSHVGGVVYGYQLREMLEHFYLPEKVEVAMSDLADSAAVTRSRFARIMNQLLDRSSGNSVTVAAGQTLIPDLAPERSDYAELMEASVAHGQGEGGTKWNEQNLKKVYDEGFVLIDGCLYYADERGYFIHDTVLGSLTFGYDGCYTSGDSNLDSYVSACIRDMMNVNPGADREGLLRAAYEYVRDSFSFLRKNTYSIGDVGWQMADAISIFECGQGNCYGYAAAFWAVSRGLGYDAEVFSGAIGREMRPHAWVEIDFDGTSYIFDPMTEADSIKNGGNVRSMFKLDPDVALNWRYFKG